MTNNISSIVLEFLCCIVVLSLNDAHDIRFGFKSGPDDPKPETRNGLTGLISYRSIVHSLIHYNFRSKSLSAMADVLWFFALATCVKLLLYPLYPSTDFNVHHQWLSLTSSLPSLNGTPTSPPRTRDYPSSYFELLLYFPASLVVPDLFPVFHRISVAASDLSPLSAPTSSPSRRVPL